MAIDKMTVLVTGSNGFIGKHLVNRLNQMESIKTIGFDLQNGDITSFPLTFEKLDHVIHLAGITYVPDSWNNPYKFYQTNIMGTVNILELCRKSHASLTHISAYVYGVPQYLPIDEKHPVQPSNPYMHSKIEAESICKFYAENHGVKITIIRPFNVYGPGQMRDFLIPKIINQVLDEGDSVKVFSLDPRRDYVYIDDLIEAIISSLNVNNTLEIVNIGSGISYSVEEIIKMCFKSTNRIKKIACEKVERKNEIPDVRANIEKARKLLNWTPKIDVEKGLKKIIDFIMVKNE